MTKEQAFFIIAFTVPVSLIAAHIRRAWSARRRMMQRKPTARELELIREIWGERTATVRKVRKVRMRDDGRTALLFPPREGDIEGVYRIGCRDGEVREFTRDAFEYTDE